MTIAAPFDSVAEADRTYYDAGPNGGDGGDGGTQWGQLTAEDTLAGGWSLASREAVDGSRDQWFLVGTAEDGTLQFINSAGRAVDVTSPDAPLDHQPHYENEEDARAAHSAWVEENGDQTEDGDEDGESSAWGQWQQVTQAADWYIYSRQHAEEDRAQFLAAGQTGDGTTVYLAPEGEVVEEQHIYDSADAVYAAIEAYASSGRQNTPEGSRPTGTNPGVSAVREDTPGDSGGSGGPLGALGDLAEPLPLAAIAAGGYVLYQQRKNGGS
ncbi:head protein [Haloarcula hispanica icosahedral virus 2]|uniref:VP5 n=1 Tax=Haloarcula hispanica icosahedral virus 2 TaxID=1154689 RepID=H9AZX6_9VIRU|nr:head protein [Haloarcula hispanica icosahedral virus 2]AFD02301.1 VP5 [Haloarcula hispanica icosahedral virus 2]